MNVWKKFLSTLLIFLFAIIVGGSTYYKYVLNRDFYSVFQVDCNPESDQCFVNNDSCEEGQDPSDCSYYFQSYIVKQSIIDEVCSPDNGDCLIDFCDKQSVECLKVTCLNAETIDFQVTGECNTPSL